MLYIIDDGELYLARIISHKMDPNFFDVRDIFSKREMTIHKKHMNKLSKEIDIHNINSFEEFKELYPEEFI